MALTADEVTALVAITRIPRQDLIFGYLPRLDSSTEAAVRTDIALWGIIRDDFARFDGGTDAFYYDPEDAREALRRRIADYLEIDCLSTSNSIRLLRS